MSNMYPFIHPTGAGKSGVIRARESRRLTSGTATIWTLSGIVLAACNHSSNDDNASTTASQQFRAAVWVAPPSAQDAGKTGVRLVFAYGATPPADETMQNLATELHITPDEIDLDPTSGNAGSRTNFANAAAKGTITATAIDADGNPLLDAGGNPILVAGILTLVSPVESVGDGIIADDDNTDNIVQWAYTPSFSGDIPGEGREAIYRSLTFRFEPNIADDYASPTIIMTFKIGGSQPVLNPVLRSDETAFTINPASGDNTADASGTIQIVIDGVAGAPIAGAGQFTVTSNLGENRGGSILNSAGDPNDGGYYGIFSIDDDTGVWSYDIDDYHGANSLLPAGDGTRTETISITYTPIIEGGVRLYQESNTINLVFTIAERVVPQPPSNSVSEAHIADLPVDDAAPDTPPPDTPLALDVL